MFNKKKIKKFSKIAIFILAVIITVTVISKTLSRYESTGISQGNIDVAFYLLNTDYQTMNINLSLMEPRQLPYVHTFLVANNDGTNRTETSLEYDLKLKTTTNLPLIFELYENENYSSPGATNIALTNNIIQDEDGTYFREITTARKNFGFAQNESNTYNLVIYFPIAYKSIDYQNIIDAVEIIIESRQII